LESVRQFARYDQGELAHYADLCAHRGRRCRSRCRDRREARPMTPSKPNPLSDVAAFLTTPFWTTGIFWVLLVASVVIAVYAWGRIPEQRASRHFAAWVF